MKTKRGLPVMTWLADQKLWRKRGTYMGCGYSFTAKEPEGVVDKIEAFKAQIDNGTVYVSMTLYRMMAGDDKK